MATLRHSDIVDRLVLSQLRRAQLNAHRAMRDRSYASPMYVKPRPHGVWLRSLGRGLLIGRDVLFALWAVAVIAFWLVIIASFAF
jgi:hypothetical protein